MKSNMKKLCSLTFFFSFSNIYWEPKITLIYFFFFFFNTCQEPTITLNLMNVII